MELREKTIVVTGAGSGIGAALSRRFAEERPRGLVLADLDLESAARVAEAIGGVAMEVDVSSAEANRALIESTEERFGPIDLFCANAGYGHAGSEQDDADTWDRMWQVNLMSHVHAARLLIPAWRARGEGYLLTTASAAGLLTNIGAAQYSVTKHAAVAFAEWLSVTYGDRGIRVSCLCPMGVKTAMTTVPDDAPDDVRLATGVVATAGAMLEPEQVADVVVDGLRAERFLILPHPEVLTFFRRKADDYDRWLAGMRRMRSRIYGDR
jgi:NAD(P)-dependent dehydrogenase (short-subunit alcohol dehydrogenase family)